MTRTMQLMVKNEKTGEMGEVTVEIRADRAADDYREEIAAAIWKACDTLPALRNGVLTHICITAPRTNDLDERNVA